MLFSIAFCIAASAAFFFPPSFWWKAMLFLSSFLAGCCVAAWGFFLKYSTPQNERRKAIADMLILCYCLAILLGKAAAAISPYTGLGLSMMLLVLALVLALRLPEEAQEQKNCSSEQNEKPVSITKPLVLLTIFILVVAINGGLMFTVQYPAYAHLDKLTSWYWAVPYVAAVLIMRKLPQKVNRNYILYAAISMSGFSFIACIVFDRSAASYLVVDTLMQGAFGVFNLFWWSILGEMLSFHKNAARIFGIGLSANVLGIFLGELIGSAVIFRNGQNLNSLLLALSVVCVTLIMLPPLHSYQTVLLKNHTYLTVLREMPQREQAQLIGNFGLEKRLSERECEIASLLFMGKTYRAIATELFISENTVKTHAKNIYAKVGVHNRTQLMNSLLDIPYYDTSLNRSK